MIEGIQISRWRSTLLVAVLALSTMTLDASRAANADAGEPREVTVMLNGQPRPDLKLAVDGQGGWTFRYERDLRSDPAEWLKKDASRAEMRMGQVIGSTNRLGEVPQDRPVHYQEVFATLYHRLGIDVGNATILDQAGRPQYLVDHRDLIKELI